MTQTKQILSRFSILYAEDDHSVQKNTVEYLSRFFGSVHVANDGQEALRLYHTMRPDALLLDIDMPHMDGLQVVQAIREVDTQIPIMMLTAFTDTDKLLHATELGLCKYLVKPVVLTEFKEAMTKISLLLQSLSVHRISLDPMHVWDKRSKQLLCQDRPVELTHKEQRLLELFMTNINTCVTFEEIMMAVWQEIDSDISIDSVKQQVRLLRKNIPQNCLHNIYGKGYSLVISDQ